MMTTIRNFSLLLLILVLLCASFGIVLGGDDDDDHPTKVSTQEERQLSSSSSGNCANHSHNDDEEDEDKDAGNSFRFDPNASILTYLNPDIFQNRARVNEISRNLKAGNLVVIRNAFQADFAEYAHQELYRDDINWTLLKGGFEDGFLFHHHNVQEMSSDFTPTMWKIHGMFNHWDSKEFMTTLSGRDCTNTKAISASASNYMAGDYSLPHSDYHDDRTVAFVWHLSKDWLPENGGALYWMKAPTAAHAFVHASYNTLMLFSVTSHSLHFVSAVGPNVTPSNKRLAFNGWYDAVARKYTLEDRLEDMTEEEMEVLSADMVYSIETLQLDKVPDKERAVRMDKRRDIMREKVFPPRGPEVYFA